MLIPALTNTLLRLAVGKVQLDFFSASNPNAVDAFVQCFDSAVGSDVTLGTSTPLFSFHIPAGSSATVSGHVSHVLPSPLCFSNGLWVAVTTGAKNSTAPTNACPVNYALRT